MPITRSLGCPSAGTQAIFGPELAELPLDALIDHVIDPLVAFHVAHLGFQALFSGSIVSPRLATAIQGFLNAVVARVQDLLVLRAPHLSPDRVRSLCARQRRAGAGAPAPGCRD